MPHKLQTLYRRFVGRWEQLISSIREHKNYWHFLLLLSLSARIRDIVVINTCTNGSDTMILDSVDFIERVPLDIDSDSINEMTDNISQDRRSDLSTRAL